VVCALVSPLSHLCGTDGGDDQGERFSHQPQLCVALGSDLRAGAGQALPAASETIPLRKVVTVENSLSWDVSYAAIPNSLLMNFIWATTSPLAALLTLPFRIMSIASMPRNVRHAVRTDP